MAAVKGKSSRILNDNQGYATRKNVGVRGFIKVYEEKDEDEACSGSSSGAQRKASIAPTGRISVALNERITRAIASSSKGGAKTFENGKAKRDSTIADRVGRRVLADVSNVRGNFTKNKLQDSTKQLKTGRNALPLTRNSLPVSKSVSSIDTAASDVKGKVRGIRREVVAGSASMRGYKSFKPCVSDQKSKFRDHETLNTNGRISARNPLPPTRKSLPVSKLPIHVNTINKKAIGESIEKGNFGVYSFPVKPKIGWKGMSQTSNARAHLWENRVSNGFTKMASKSQSAVGVKAPPRNSKQIIKSTCRASSPKTTLKSNDNEVASISANSTTTAEEPRAEGEAQTDRNSIISSNKTVSDAKKKSSRRKSFTSLLMARSKLVEETSQCIKQNLPSVYDDGNHLEVFDYVDEIYQYYWTLEAENGSLINYMESQTQITPQMRGILVNWLIEVHSKFDLMPETLYLTVTLLDRYLSLVIIKKNELQLVGLTALLLASKYEDFWHPRVLDLVSISVDSYTRDQMLGMEKAMLKKLKFRLNTPTPYVFMLRFLKASQSDKKLEDLSFYLIDLCLVDCEALKFKPSLLCASAIYVARCTLLKTTPWTPLLCIYTRYEEYQLRDCAKMVLKFHKSAKTSRLKVTFEKYSKPEYSEVANVKPLNMLPLN